MKVRITLTEEMLGTKAANPDVFADYIASKHPKGTPQRDELEKAEHCEDSGTTVFHRHEGQPMLWDYMFKGFFKDACGALNRFDKEFRNGMEKLPAFKTKIDGTIFVNPRIVPIVLPEGGVIGVCERPLRADTAQGPRVALARSETVPPGSYVDIDIEILSKELFPWVQLFLDYGSKRGLGQWRNSGKGRFTWARL